MGILNNGIGGNFIGKSGNMVFYMLNGKNVGRRIGENLNPPTQKQLSCRQQIALVAELLNPIKELVKIGYQSVAITANRHPYVLATSFHKNSAIRGTYPEQCLDFSQLQFSTGNLRTAQSISVTYEDDQILFEWTNRSEMTYAESRDQVMLLAYYPEINVATYTLYGNERRAGHDILAISPDFESGRIETYMAFISADRKNVSDSIYTGQFSR